MELGKGKGETAAVKKIRTEQLKNETDHVKKEKDLQATKLHFEQDIAASKATLLKEALQLVEDNLDKESTDCQIFKAARKAAAIAEIGVNLVSEIQNNAL